ncbi:hypothetical protein [Flavobacterium sp.]|uniref:hypothetical protein n=1 Tax=Flavobacterium sp. TaxID=239 RepID=UPI00286CB3A8|nr:hypothetical protein [Flavobacterium sp.]
MIYKFHWNSNAEITLQDESFFILLKWNAEEVQKFIDLVEENLERLSKNPKTGIYNKELNVYFLVISKQTTLYYDFSIQTNVIELYVFWNNLKNPQDLIKLL